MSREKRKLFLFYFLSTAYLVVSGALFALLGANRLPYRLGTFPGGVLFAACFVSAITDLCVRKIFNVVTYPAFLVLLLALLISPALPPEFASKLGYGGPFLPQFLAALEGFALCVSLLLVLCIFWRGGGGDAKLGAAIGLGLGAADGIASLGATFIFAAVFSVLEAACLSLLRKIAAKRTTKKKGKSQDEEKPRLDGSDTKGVSATGIILAPLGLLLTLCLDGWTKSKKIMIPMGLSFLAGTTLIVSGVLTDFLIGLLSE